MLKLYHFWSSTCSKKVRIALAEKGLDWESRHIDLGPKQENTEPWYVKLNPNGVVPTLDHDGRIIIESNVIIEYLDDVFPDIHLRPGDAYGRAQMRIWLDRTEHVVHRNVNMISFNRRFLPRLAEKSDAEKEAVINRMPNLEKRREMLRRLRAGVSVDDEAQAEAALAGVMDMMEVQLGQTPWLAGEEFSLADICITPFIERFGANGLTALIDWRSRPAVGDWWRRIQSRPSYDEGMNFPNPAAA
ncbi:MAG: glutathione S-transferase family protein [Rhodospirillales bacterium]|nr:glutathione S-transferase family protein [Rhodospirillales bacterium]